MLTCLKFDKAIHTKEKCYEVIENLKEEGKVSIGGFNKDIRKMLRDSIYCPEDVEIKQEEVDNYYDFIEA